MPLVEFVLPVYNEDQILAASVGRLQHYLNASFPFDWRITIADNASTDATSSIAQQLAESLPGVHVLRLNQKGRGRALRAAWGSSSADVVAYMDIDLSTGLDAILPLVAPLISGHSDIAIGSRLARNSAVERGPRRELISRGYNTLLRTVFTTTFHDAQCGFKAMRRDIAVALLPHVEDDGWFFDTELLVLADHNGLRIQEVPVDWTDDTDSRVHLASTMWGDLRGVGRMAWRLLRGRATIDLPNRRLDRTNDLGRQVVSFAAIGAVSTAVSLLLFVWLRGSLGTVAAHIVALTATTVANVWANRRFTFRRRGRQARFRQLTLTLGLYVATAALSSLTLSVVQGRLIVEAAVIAATWTTATLARFALMRGWVYRRSPTH